MNPKTHLFVFITVLSLKTGCYLAQEKKLELGLITGMGVHSIRNPSFSYKNSSPGFNAGLLVQYHASNKIALKMDIMWQRNYYSQQVDLTDSYGNNMGTARYFVRYTYISLPIMASWKFGNKTKFVLNTGAYLNGLINQSSYGINSTSATKFENVQKDFLFDGGLLLGFGLSKSLSKRMLLHMEFRNSIGVIDVSRPAATSKVYLNSQYFLVGIGFVLGNS